jgi:endonuclease/exonuclease/phosphatase family metal-dependent hydrolase
MADKKIVRILTLNIAHGRGLSTYQGFVSERGIQRCLSRVGRLLQRVDADIVALQEVDEDSHWNRGIHLLDVLQEQVGYPHAYLGVHNRRAGKLQLAYGNGLLTQFPIRHAEHTAFGGASLGEKGFMCAELVTSHGILPVVNLHLDFRSRLRRIEQVKRLIRFLDDKKYTRAGTPHLSPIVCGDFNSGSGKPGDAVRYLFHYLQEQCAYQLVPTGRKSRTFPSLFPIHGLDFVFVPPSYKVRSSKVLRSYVSDHRPVFVELEVLPHP